MTTSLAAPPAIPTQTERWATWDRFLKRTPDAGFMQSSWWADFRTTNGYEYFGAVLKDGGTVVGGAVVLKLAYAPGLCFYYMPDGPVLPEEVGLDEDIYEAIVQTIEERRVTESETVSHLRIEPRWKTLPGFLLGFRPVPRRDGYTEPRDTLYVDLRPDESAILAQMKPKGRYNINVARRHGVSVVEDVSDTGVKDFLRIYEDTARRQGFGAKPRDYFVNLISALVSAQSGTVFFAEYGGVRLAAAIVVYFGSRATYFYGGSLTDHRHVMAPCLLHFEIMRRARTLGCQWYDFWGIAPEGQADHPWHDITVFKRKFGGVEVNLVPTLDHVFDREAYERYRILRR